MDKKMVKDRICEELASTLDFDLFRHGFRRRKSAIKYNRTLHASEQVIDIYFEMNPRENPKSIAAIYPYICVKMPAVSEVLIDMVNCNNKLIANAPDIILNEPIDHTAPKGELGRWYIDSFEEVSLTLSRITQYLMQWTIELLNSYHSPDSIVDAYINEDHRVDTSLQGKLRVVAAFLLLDREEEALDVMNKWFGQAGPRKDYAVVFEYINKKIKSKR